MANISSTVASYTKSHVNSVKNWREALFVVILFAIYPILSLPFIFIEIYNKKRYAFSLLAIFIGYMGLLYPPFGDFYRYAEDCELYALCSFDELMEVTTLKMDYLFPIFLWTLGKLHIPSDFGRFITTWLSFQLLLSVIYDIIKSPAVSNKKCLFIVIAFLCFSPFYNYLTRFDFSRALFIYSSYKLIICKNKKSLLLLVIAVLNHFSYIVLALVLVCYFLFHYKPSRRIVLWSVLLSFIFSFDVFTPIIAMLPLDPYVVDHLFEYIDGYWANEYVSSGSIFFQILLVISKIGFYFCWLFIYFKYKGTEWERYITYLLILLLICSPFKGIYNRYYSVAVIVMLLDVLHFFAYNIVKKNTKILFCAVCSFLLIIGLWSVRRQLSISQERLIFAPGYKIVTHSYDASWRHTTLDSEGMLP